MATAGNHSHLDCSFFGARQQFGHFPPISTAKGRKALMELDLGRRPAPLHFTASFVMDPPNLLASEAAALAQKVTGSAEN